MRPAHSLHAAARKLLLATLIALALPLSAVELRAQGGDLSIGLSAADREVIAGHLLTMEEMRKLAAFTKEFAVRAKRDSKICALIQQEIESMDTPADRSIAARVRALEAEPVMREALQASGVTAQEWVVINITYATTMMENFARVSGRALYDDPVKVNPANHQFLDSHAEEISKLFGSVPDPCP